MAQTVAEMIELAKGRIENLTAEGVKAEVDGGDLLLVDVREADELENTGSIPGAHHAPRGMLEFYADPQSPYHRPEFDPSRRTVIYCAAGSRSALAAEALRELGYEDVAHLDGGFKSWTESGFPTSSS